MSLSIKPINCKQCASCYEANIKNTGWDIEKVIESLKIEIFQMIKGKSIEEIERMQVPTLHGGEPLLLPLRDIERLLEIIRTYFGRTAIQTNLMHLKKEHIELFKRYNTSVGISIDGIDLETNRSRFPENVSDEQIIEGTAKILSNIVWLKESLQDNQYNKDRDENKKLNLSCIIVLRKYNSNRILDIVKKLSTAGIRAFRINPGIVYDEKLRKKEEITPVLLFNSYRNIFLNLKEFEHNDISIRPIQDIVDGMFGYIDNMSCTFGKCDPFCTGAEKTICGNGSIGGCLHPAAAIDGLQILRAEKQNYNRYEILKNIPFENCGCKDCRFWYMCYGGCPGAGIDNEWRNKTRFCHGLTFFYEFLYDYFKTIMPNIHLTPDFYPEKPIPEIMLKSISGSVNSANYRKNPQQMISDYNCKHGITQQSKQKKWISINDHDDSDSAEWRKLNPGWIKKI